MEEMTMKTVFIVYESYYSLYLNGDSKRIDRIFLSETKAKEYVDIQNKRNVKGYDYEIEEEYIDDSL